MVVHRHFSVDTTIDMGDLFWCAVTLACVMRWHMRCELGVKHRSSPIARRDARHKSRVKGYLKQILRKQCISNTAFHLKQILRKQCLSNSASHLG